MQGLPCYYLRVSFLAWVGIRHVLSCRQQGELLSRYVVAHYASRFFLSSFSVRTNYWTISLDHILNWKSAALKFLPNTTQWTYIWNGLNATKTISREGHTSLFDKMPALSIELIWCVLEFARSNRIVKVRFPLRRQFWRRGPPASSIRKSYE
jgi:hypothetical protein